MGRPTIAHPADWASNTAIYFAVKLRTPDFGSLPWSVRSTIVAAWSELKSCMVTFLQISTNTEISEILLIFLIFIFPF